MKKLSFWLLLPVILFFFSGCYTQVVTKYVTRDADGTEVVDSTVVATETPVVDTDFYVGYGYRYSGLDYYGGYQPYWYDGFYTPWYNPYRGYVIPFRSFMHRPFTHTPNWRFPFGHTPPRHFGTDWHMLQPKNPPRVVPHQKGPGRESVRDAIIKRDVGNTRYIPQRIQMPVSRSPQVRDMRQQRSNYTPMTRGNERNYPINTPTYSQPRTQSTPSYNPPANNGGNRSSGATRSDHGKSR